jgi:hypothetical protein
MISFKTNIPEGFERLEIVVSRRIDQDYPDLDLGSVRVLRPDLVNLDEPDHEP